MTEEKEQKKYLIKDDYETYWLVNTSDIVHLNKQESADIGKLYGLDVTITLKLDKEFRQERQNCQFMYKSREARDKVFKDLEEFIKENAEQ